MTDGIRAEVELGNPAHCTIAAVARDGLDVRSVSRCHDPDEGEVTMQFTVTTDADTHPGNADVDVEEVFAYGDTSVRRVTRDREERCLCERVERHGTPIENVRTEAESVLLTFYARDVETLRAILRDVASAFDDVSLRRIVRSGGPDASRDLVLVDRASLTDRQREVLETAHRMDYFARGEGANATEVAAELGINGATFAEHLAVAQAKLMDELLAE
ncbi:helix-turn-helix domain-containing protein [Salinigranum sp. GCM10025319]|uniref:helix-turn-helix domain-containing protein n=1 Tax=Salinigranum sp. GCM10025319 TaxID=3252687 RepID=UPI00360EED26